MMLKPKAPVEDFIKKFGFKYCKKPYNQCAYLCVNRGRQMIFVSPIYFDVFDWDENDPRIHKKANCRYKDIRTAIDFVYEMIKEDMLVVFVMLF